MGQNKLFFRAMLEISGLTTLLLTAMSAGHVCRNQNAIRLGPRGMVDCHRGLGYPVWIWKNQMRRRFVIPLLALWHGARIAGTKARITK